MLSNHQKRLFLLFLAVLAAFLFVRPDFSLQAALPRALAATPAGGSGVYLRAPALVVPVAPGPHSVPWNADAAGGRRFTRVTVADDEETIEPGRVE